MVVVDKFAAESVMLGSKLYEPGILRSERVEPGDEVFMVDPRGHVVGTGIATVLLGEEAHHRHSGRYEGVGVPPAAGPRVEALRGGQDPGAEPPRHVDGEGA